MTEHVAPEIRIDGFGEPWAVQTLGDAALVNPAGAVPEIFEYVDLSAVSGTEMVSHRTESRSSAPSRAQRVAASGDIFFQTVRPYQGNNHLFTQEDRAFVFSSGYAQLRPYVDSKTLFAAIQRRQFLRAVLDRCTGTSFPAIAPSALKEVTVSFPVQSLEQEQIGALFSELDSLIVEHRRKHEHLGKTKVALMRKMFPQGDADEPELRFEGFSGPWGRVTLGSIAKVSSAARVHKSQWKLSGVPFYRASDVTAFWNGTSNTKAFISFDLYEKLVATSGRLRKGDLLVVGGGSVGVPYIVPDNEPLYSKDADLLWVHPLQDTVSEYLALYLTSLGFQQYLKSISHSGTIAHYTIVQAKATPLRLPATAEQQVIGTFFNELDALIQAEQQYFQQLQQVKSALLQKMFV